MNHCSYYQANVKRSECWFLAAIFRSYEHLAFDRTLDLSTSLFEFFVPESMEKEFLKIMSYFQEKGIVRDLKKLPNRLLDPAEKV